jgi:hypothetical protein
MKMMGVSDAALWMSWFLTYSIIFLFADLLLAASLKFVKRYHALKRDISSLLCLILVPAILMLVGVIAVRVISSRYNASLTIDFTQYGALVPVPSAKAVPISDFIRSFENYYPSSTSPVSWETRVFNSSSFENNPKNLFETGISDNSESILKQRTLLAQEILSKSNFWVNPVYGGYVDVSNNGSFPIEFWIYLNQTGLHGKSYFIWIYEHLEMILAMPTFVNLLSNLILKNITGNRDASISVVISPFPQTLEESQAEQKNNAVWACLFFLQALAFIPATYIVHIVLERQSKAKHQQIMSGVGLSAYC